MVAAVYMNPSENRNERKAQLIAAVITTALALLLFLALILIHLVTPIPAIPPPPDEVQVTIDNGEGSPTTNTGGASMGNTGQPGSQEPNPGATQAAASNNTPQKATPGVITNDAEKDNPSATSGSNSSANTEQISPEMQAVLNKWNKNKGSASIKVGGQGTVPYSSGIGNDSVGGPGVGPGHEGANGNGHDNGGARYRHILSKPDIVNPTQEEGKVVVNVYVDQEGNVKRAEVNANGTTTLNSILRSTATQSAYKIKFDADPAGPQVVVIPIDIYFTLK